MSGKRCRPACLLLRKGNGAVECEVLGRWAWSRGNKRQLGCFVQGLSHVVNLSTFRSQNFGYDYGVTMTDGPLAGLLSRAIVVLDGEGTVVYTEQVPEIVQEPNYEQALAAAK